MSNMNVVRAWKDATYRRSLSAEDLAQLPENPAGLVELTDSELRKAGGFGGGVGIQTTILTCTATVTACCPNGTTAATCTATYGSCCL